MRRAALYLSLWIALCSCGCSGRPAPTPEPAPVIVYPARCARPAKPDLPRLAVLSLLESREGYARLIGEVRPRYVIIENVRGLLSRGIEIVLQDLAALGYDAEWEVLPAAAFGAPHHRERVFIVAYPHGRLSDGGHRLLSPLQGNLGNVNQSPQLFDWLGLRIDRACKASTLEAYPGPVLYRVDDGRTERLDGTGRPQPGQAHKIGRVDTATARAWVPRLKALGNGITPRQSYAVAACILQAEGLPVPPRP